MSFTGPRCVLEPSTWFAKSTEVIKGSCFNLGTSDSENSTEGLRVQFGYQCF